MILLHERLRFLRKKRKKTLVEVSVKTKISVSFLSEIERGIANPSAETLQRLADYYDGTISWLVAGSRIYKECECDNLEFLCQ